MVYNFSNFLELNEEIILEKFLDQYTSYVNTYDEYKRNILFNYYKEILYKLNGEFKINEVLDIFEKIAQYKISLNVPYVLMTSDVNTLKNILISFIRKDNINSSIIDLLDFFNDVNNKVANVYLKDYISSLISINSIRFKSLSNIIDKNHINHYEAHLLWLNNLVECIKNKNLSNFPELDAGRCEFGIWIKNEAKEIIQDDVQYEVINFLHNNLHKIAKNIMDHFNKKESHILLTYLEKCEYISLCIGTELALIDTMIINKQILKDNLTNAINRQGLVNIFTNQYELSLATNNSFILAMCDLDYFKNINDTYGHVAGDKILKLFVDTVKKHIRNSDVIIRYGGEEFTIILPSIKKAKGFEVLENIRKSFEDAVLEFEGDTIKSTVSIGLIEILPIDSFKSRYLDEFIMLADQKLYLAKDNGRNRVESN